MGKIADNQFILFCLVTMSVSCNQNTKEEKLANMTKSELATVTQLTDLVKDLPKDHQTLLYEFTAKCDGKLRVESCDAVELNEGSKKLLSLAQAGSKVYIDLIIDSDSTKKHSYEILVSE